jgi:hypothetical protein
MTSVGSMTWCALLAGALMLAGCAADTPSGENGSLEVSLQLEGDIDIEQVEWVITAEGMEDMSGVIDTSAPGSTASVEVFGLPPGDGYTITMTATGEDGETQCSGSADFPVEAGVATKVMVMLNCKPPEDLGGVRVNGKLNVCADLVKVVVAPLQTSVGNDIDLSALGFDYEDDELEYLWEGSGGTVDDPGAADTFFRCEELGKQEVRVTVSDDGFEDCNCDWTVAVTCLEGEIECENDDDCSEGEICEDGMCIPDLECAEDSDCDDADVCTVNTCVDGVCEADAVICEDDNECTAGACDSEIGCEFTPVDDGTECDEGNGACMAGECKTNELLGNEFVVVFGENYVCDLGTEICGPQPTQPNPELTLFLSGPTATAGVVSILSSGFTTPFEVTPGAVTTVALPEASELRSSDVVETEVAVRIEAEEQIAAYGLNRITQTTDAFAAIPTDALGQRYRVMAWPASINGPSQLAIAAIAPDGDMSATTNVTITPSDDAGSRAAGVPYTIELGPFDAYQLQSDGDLTGTLIESDEPVAVFGGNRCGNIPGPNTGFCDHLVEQIPPTSSWGSEALTVPLATRFFGDTFVVLADQDGTTVSVQGEASDSFVLDAGESEQLLLESSHRVTADAPILVSQYSNGSEWDGETADPFMMLIPTSAQFVEGYTFATATPGMGFTDNYANIVALTSDAAAGDVLLDGVSVPPGSFTELVGTGYSAAQVPIAVGTHTLEAPNPLGLYVYGYADFDSYGYPGGFSVAIAP